MIRDTFLAITLFLILAIDGVFWMSHNSRMPN